MNLGETYVLDGIDRQLLDELQSDCKRSLKEIGAAVGLSAPSVMERVRKLENAGIIKGYHAVLDARKLGLDISAFIGVSISDPRCFPLSRSGSIRFRRSWNATTSQVATRYFSR